MTTTEGPSPDSLATETASKFGGAFGTSMGRWVAAAIMGLVFIAAISFAYAIHLRVSQLKSDYGREIDVLKADLKKSDDKLLAAQKELRDKTDAYNSELALRKRLEQDNTTYRERITSLEAVSRQNAVLAEENRDLASRNQARLAIDELQRQKGITAQNLRLTVSHPCVIQKMKGGGVSLNDGHPVWNVVFDFKSDSKRSSDYDAGNRVMLYPKECSVAEKDDGNLQVNVE